MVHFAYILHLFVKISEFKKVKDDFPVIMRPYDSITPLVNDKYYKELGYSLYNLPKCPVSQFQARPGIQKTCYDNSEPVTRRLLQRNKDTRNR